MATIGAANGFGLPVSTTHVLSSGVAGTMAANGSGIELSALRNMAQAGAQLETVGEGRRGHKA